MKKILSTVTLFVALALTACSGATSSSAASSSKKSSSSAAPAHQHTYATEWSYDDEYHWHAATCEHTDAKGDKAAHTWVDDTTQTGNAATCERGGTKYEKCSVCGKTRQTETGKLPHNWEKVKDNAEEAGYAKTTQYKCSYGDHYALRWSALDLDQEASLEACGLSAVDSSIYAEINNSGSHEGSVRLKKAENDGGTAKLGTHIVYKVKVGTAVQNADLEFQIDPKDGYDVPVFDYVSNDQQQGYVEDAEGNLVLTTKRYGLRVNGQEVTLGEDLHGNVNGGSKLWFNWNVQINLNAGENVIDIYCLGGYRAYIYNFQLAGLPANA